MFAAKIEVLVFHIYRESKMKCRILTVALASILLSACGSGDKTSADKTDATANQPSKDSKALNVYNWSDYIAEDTIPNFEKQSGVKVKYDVFDSNETLQVKVLAGNTGYDIVVPSLQFLPNQVKAGVYQEIDKTKLKNYGNLDPEIMKRIAGQDPDNKFAIPYLWGTTGIGYNIDKVNAAFGKETKLDSWEFIFNPANLSKLKDCGISMLDTPSELVPIALRYLGKDPNSKDEKDILAAEAALMKVRPYVRYFHSSQYIGDLAGGDICLAIGWSGDVFIARDRAVENAEKNKTPPINIGFSIPKEGTLMFFDMIAIPKDAKNLDNAYAFIDYLLDAQVAANNSNFVSYPNANKASWPMINKEVRENPEVFPNEETMAKLFIPSTLSGETKRLYTDVWDRVKTGKQ
jgi:putrescine transport system substrate-binding protein